MAAPTTDTSKPSSVSSRWLIPLGAVLVHICIGSVYAWSNFNRPINALFPGAPAWLQTPYINFTPALVLLGLSAAFGGPWVERRGPRVAAAAAAIFFGAGLIVGGLGLAIKQPTIRPAPKKIAAAAAATRGPLRSTHGPPNAALNPSRTSAGVKLM